MTRNRRLTDDTPDWRMFPQFAVTPHVTERTPMFTTNTMIEKLSRRLAGGTAVACCLLASAPAQAALTFSFIF